MKPDVVIIGGGVIGAATAYFVARRGGTVLILERRHLAAGASGVTAAMIGTGSGAASPLFPLARESIRLIPQVQEETGIDLEIIRGGAVTVTFDEDQTQAFHERVVEDRKLGIESEVLDGRAARQLEPLLSARITAALHHRGDYHLNPFRLCQAYLRGAQQHGAQIRCGITVHDVAVADDRIERVVTDDGDFHAAWVVIACGAWSAKVLRRAQVKVQVVPARGQAIVTEACPPMTPRIINCAQHLYVRQVARGNFYLGSQTEYVEFDNRITLSKISAYTRAVVMAVPVIAHLRAERFFAGFRPMTPDNLPLLGPMPNCPKLVIATGHGRSGMLHSASTGKAVSELIIDGHTEHPIDAFRVDRFSNQASGERTT